jgi:hypothetical protein
MPDDVVLKWLNILDAKQVGKFEWIHLVYYGIQMRTLINTALEINIIIT